jgi:nucleoside 2-deoxyribosyltransferase
MKMKITLCSSAKFFDRLWDIEKALKEKGYEVLLPSMKDYHMEDSFAKIQHNLIREHFNKIDQSDAIYVANYDKNGIEGYIGGNSFLEMGKAFDKGIPIFLMKNIPKKMNYTEELIALKPLIAGENWDMLDNLLKEYYKK